MTVKKYEGLPMSSHEHVLANYNREEIEHSFCRTHRVLQKFGSLKGAKPDFVKPRPYNQCGECGLERGEHYKDCSQARA